jgi:hypothetical protein
VDAKIEVQRQWLKVPEDLLFLLTIQVEKPLVIQLRMNGSDITIENGEQLIDKVGLVMRFVRIKLSNLPWKTLRLVLSMSKILLPRRGDCLSTSPSFQNMLKTTEKV